MKFYHGTSLKAATRMVTEGIKPRGGGSVNNWKHTVDSNAQCVYLTIAYPLHFMWNATRCKTNFGAIVEIDPDRLDQLRLLPDEDSLAQIDERLGMNPETGSTLYEKTRWYRDRLVQWSDGETWKKSIEAMGTCCYFGTVSAQAITRIAIIDLKKNARLAFQFDPTISVLNYHFMRPYYLASSMAIFGDEPGKELMKELMDGGPLYKNWRPEITNLRIRDIDAERASKRSA